MPARRFVTDFLSPRPLLDPLEDAAPSREGAEDAPDALLVLNYHLPAATPLMWARSATRVCADGGANRLYDELPGMFPARAAADVRASHVPDAIVGDLDSVRPDVLAYYRAGGCRAVDLSHDQDTTDLRKAVTAMVAETEHLVEFAEAEWGAARADEAKRDPNRSKRAAADKRNPGSGATSPDDANPPSPPRASSEPEPEAKVRKPRILVAGGLGGRFDHEMAHLSVMHEFDRHRVVLVGRYSTATLIPPGETVIVPDASAEGPTCGLVPLAGPARVHTRGLRWNLAGETLRFGEFVSTSNRLERVEEGNRGTASHHGEGGGGGGGFGGGAGSEGGDDEDEGGRRAKAVTVRTDAPLVWTTVVRGPAGAEGTEGPER